MDAAASANRVMVGCRHAITEDGQEAVTRGFCLGSVSAVWDFAGVCSPRGAVLGQAVRIVVEYIDSRPARLNEPFNALAAEALRGVSHLD
jgi:Rap1a immunity proteins